MFLFPHSSVILYKYIIPLQGINNLAILERFEDDKVKISESELFYPMLKLVKKSLVDKVDQVSELFYPMLKLVKKSLVDKVEQVSGLCSILLLESGLTKEIKIQIYYKIRKLSI